MFPLFLQPGEDEYTIVPNTEFVVSRTAFKDNSSNYSINGKRATYKEVGNLLRGNGIDLDHNRFLILQVVTCLTHFIFVDSSSVICWMNPIVILGVSDLFCHFCF